MSAADSARRAAALAAFALAALVAAAPDAEARPRTLERAEIVELLTGNTIFGFVSGNESRFSMFHSGSGQVRAELRNVNGRTTDSDGRWWVTDEGRLCVDWTNYRWIDSCHKLVADGEAITFRDESGRIVSIGEVVPGNPDDL